MFISLFISVKKIRLPIICGILLGALCILNPLFSQEGTQSGHSEKVNTALWVQEDTENGDFEKAQRKLGKRSALTVSTGIAHNVLTDYFNTGKNESSLAGTFRLGLDYIEPRYYQSFFLEAGVSFDRYPTADIDFFFSDGVSKYQTFQVFYGFYFSVLPPKLLNLKIFNLYVGFNIDQSLEIWHIPNTGAYDWIDSLKIGPGIVVVLDWAKHNFRANYSLPVLGTLSRSVHTTEPYRLLYEFEETTGILFDLAFPLALAEGDRFLSWGNVFMSSLALDYEWKFSKRVGLLAHYDLAVAVFNPVNNFPRIINFTHKFNIGLSFSFYGR